MRILYIFLTFVIGCSSPDHTAPKVNAKDRGVNCTSNVYNCGDFLTCEGVMRIFNSCPSDIHRLDGNGDGVPCQSLCNGYSSFINRSLPKKGNLSSKKSKNGSVERVVDGDTVYVLGRKIRLLNIDTEESVHPQRYRNTDFGVKTSSWAKSYLKGKSVLLDCEDRKKDRYGRELCYIILKKSQVNYNVEAVRRGYSKYYIKYGRSKSYHEDFVKAEEEARLNLCGVWSKKRKTCN